jgi:hypothetical protein
MHVQRLGKNLLALATQGSFARGSDSGYSDVELVAFVRDVPEGASWADCVQIWHGMLIDIIWTTKEGYIARVKEVTPQWYLAGSDYLGVLINAPLIDEINNHVPADLVRKCRGQALLHWPVTQEAAGKVLNAVLRDNRTDVARLFFALLDHVLIELAFLNARPYASASTMLEEALTFAKRPAGFDELAEIAMGGDCTDFPRTRRAVEAVIEGMEEFFEREGIALYASELILHPAPAR